MCIISWEKSAKKAHLCYLIRDTANYPMQLLWPVVPAMAHINNSIISCLDHIEYSGMWTTMHNLTDNLGQRYNMCNWREDVGFGQFTKWWLLPNQPDWPAKAQTLSVRVHFEQSGRWHVLVGIAVEPFVREDFNQDTMHGPSYIEKCTKLPLKWGHLL